MDLHKTYKITSILSILLSMASFVSGSITLHFNFNLSNLMLLIYYTPLIITTCLAEFKHWIILFRRKSPTLADMAKKFKKSIIIWKNLGFRTNSNEYYNIFR